MRLMMLVAALSSCDALRLAGVAQPRSALRSRVPHISLKQQRKGGLFGAMDDILDYVSDLGGYTGFTEADLKDTGGEISNERMEKRAASEDFGKPTEDLNDNITTAFVVLLIAFPSVIGLIGASIYGTPAIFRGVTKDM